MRAQGLEEERYRQILFPFVQQMLRLPDRKTRPTPWINMLIPMVRRNTP